MTINKNICIIGLPESGKTTFIAALWALMLHDSPYGSLILETLKQGDHQYLNKICDQWLTLSKLERTMLVKENRDIIMALKNKNTNGVITLNIPDFYGELFDTHFEHREWSEEYHSLIENSSEFLLFIDPFAKNSISRTIMDVQENMKQFPDLINKSPEEKNNNERTQKQNSTNKTYEHIETPNQVKIVDMLQFLVHSVEIVTKFKLSIIVSKWDKVMAIKQDECPEKLIKHNLPLLHQYLKCNSHIFTTKYFGVSAQGGDYEIPDQKAELLDKTPWDRIIVFDGQSHSKDIALPLTWLTE